MNRFFALFKKEVRELLTLQMILQIIIGMLVFVFIGNVVGKETTKAREMQNIIINDMDSSASSEAVIDILESSGFHVFLYNEEEVGNLFDNAREKEIYSILVVPQGFEKNLSEMKTPIIQNYSIVRGMSLLGLMNSGVGSQALSIINEHFSNILIKEKAVSENPQQLKNPVTSENVVVMGSKTANISPEELAGFLNTQSMFIPIVIFLIIIMASQTVVVSIASEKENKTLETLLSTPLSRISIVMAKMSAAGIVSLIMAIVYMFGMNYYINGLTGGITQGQSSQVLADALNKLGMDYAAGDYVLIGISLFLSILIALAVSLILGVFSEDVKKAQAMITPIIFLVMVPYFITMFMNLDTASTAIKVFVYAIPFSHSFLVSQNIFFNRHMDVTLGIIYQLAVLAILVIIAARIFTTDRVLTAKIRFEKRTNLSGGNTSK
ncbi:MAG: ABC transporter permease [Clostridiaceae bacterium]|nr:ABC transporter permease [Clostridiaceae bacterium]